MLLAWEEASSNYNEKTSMDKKSPKLELEAMNGVMSVTMSDNT